VLFGAWGYLHGVIPHVGGRVGVLAFAPPLLFSVGLVGLRSCLKLGESRLADTGFGLGFLGMAMGSARGVGLSVPGGRGEWGSLAILAASLTLVGIVALGRRGSGRLGALLLATAALGWIHVFTDEYPAGVARLAHLASGALFCLSWVVLGIRMYQVGRTKS
jgi:hypothetical protein